MTALHLAQKWFIRFNMNRMRKFAAIITLFFISADLVRMPLFQEPNNANAKIKATFIYNFTKYVDWPDKYKEGNFIIGVLSAPAFYNDLGKLLKEKKSGSQSFEIKNFENAESIQGLCHILFIPKENSQLLPEVLKKIKGKSTLVITEKSGLAKQGAAINFIVENNKQRFELNKTNIEKYSMKVSSSLLALAIEVE